MRQIRTPEGPVESQGQRLADWRRVLARAVDLGVPWLGTRFERYFATLEDLHAREVAGVAARREFGANTTKQRLLFEGAGQMWSLSMSEAAWNLWPQDLLRRKLRTVFGGPDLPSATGSDQARDALLELLAAALGVDYGFELLPPADDEDVRLFAADTGTVVVECKRARSLRSLRTALAKARSQLWKRTERGRHRGVVVLGLDRVVGVSGALLQAADAAELVEALDLMEEKAHTRIRAVCQEPNRGLAPTSPIGLLVIAGAVVVRKPVDHVYHFCRVQPFDTGRPEDVPAELEARLNAAGHLLAAFQVPTAEVIQARAG